MLKAIYDAAMGKMRVAGLASGSGASIRTVIEQQVEMQAKGGCPYEVVAVFTDNPKSNVFVMGKEFHVPVFLNDIHAFYEKRGKKISDKKVREEFDRETIKLLEPHKPDFLAYAGYVWATTAPLVHAFTGINGHPADLSIMKDGKRAFAGANGVRDALAAGETELRATLHLVTTEIDHGPILMISEPVRVEKGPDFSLDQASREYLKLVNQKMRKLFPRVIKDIAEGTFKRDEKGALYYGSNPIPNGYRL